MRVQYSTNNVHHKTVQAAALILLNISDLFIGCSYLMTGYNMRDTRVEGLFCTILADTINNKCFQDNANLQVYFSDEFLIIRCQPYFPIEWFSIEIERHEIKTISTIVNVMLN